MRISFCLIIVLLTLDIAAAQNNNPAASPDAYGPAFRFACWAGDLNKATALLNAGAPLEGTDNLGRTPLILACRNHPDVVKMLLAHGANINAAENDGDLAINHACEAGDLASTQLLLAAGSPLNPVDKNGHTPLIQASREGHDSVVAWLIGQHVDVNFHGLSDPAIFYAIWRDHVSTAKLLLNAGADLRVGNAAVPDPNRALFLNVAWAVATNDVEIIDLLLSHGVDVNCNDFDGTTALMRAVQSAKPPMIAHLLEKGADPNLADNQGRTALMLSVNYQQGGDREGIQPLLDHGAKLEARDKQGRTALIWAGIHEYEPVVSFLVSAGADINAADESGETALTYAGDRGNDEIVEFLKGKGAKRTDVHIIARPQPNPPESYAHQWSLDVGAIYTQRNGQNPYMLGQNDLDNIDELKKQLKSDWNITDRASFLKEIDDLRTSGQRTGAQATGITLYTMSEVEFAEYLITKTPIQQTALKVLRSKYSKWKDKCGLAWDLCRLANLINLGCAASYISKDEAWPLLMDNALQVQNSFTSWQEMCDNFLDGREMWAEWDDTQYEACAKLLLNPQDPNSPWNQLPWNTDLTGN
jgi:ankyrin repeat protein